ncbi:hypothetical protein NFI96_009261 [Prochilodus magdalenae]|nr:hypothetical protein NFI96_009261 [Prochilodus magdalenae]
METDYSKGLKSEMDYRGKRHYIMYHGTTMEIAQKIQKHGFTRSSDGMLGPGVYVSRSLEKATRYPLNPPAGKKLAILKLKVRVGKVKKIDKQGHPLQKTWHKNGYDTAWVPPNCGMVKSGLEEDCVWDPDLDKKIGTLAQEGGDEKRREEKRREEKRREEKRREEKREDMREEKRREEKRREEKRREEDKREDMREEKRREQKRREQKREDKREDMREEKRREEKRREEKRREEKRREEKRREEKRREERIRERI